MRVLTQVNNFSWFAQVQLLIKCNSIIGILFIQSVISRQYALSDVSQFMPFFKQEWNTLVMNLAIAFSRDELRVRKKDPFKCIDYIIMNLRYYFVDVVLRIGGKRIENIACRNCNKKVTCVFF